LHLTDSAVKIKFPNIGTISSEQLIEKVQDFPFSDYYDHMARIMKNEQMKLDEQNKEETLSQHQSSTNKFFAKFKYFFGLNRNKSCNVRIQNVKQTDDMSIIDEKNTYHIAQGGKDNDKKKHLDEIAERTEKQVTNENSGKTSFDKLMSSKKKEIKNACIKG